MISQENKPAFVAGLGVLVLVGGIFMAWYGFPKILDMKIKETIALEEGTEGYEMWKKFPIPLKFKVYIFDIQNPNEVQQGANPIVRERGPYIYDQYRHKEKIKINEAADTIEYVLKKHFVFNQEESGCYSIEDEVTVLNAALVGTALTVQSMFPSALSTISEAVPFLFPGITNIFMKVKVKDLLFDGLLLDCSSEDVEFVCTAIKGTAPETIRQHENKRDFLFSLFHHLNDTDEGPYVIGRGLKNTTRGIIYGYQGEKNLKETWHSPQCNMINGTDSTMYPSMGPDPPPKIFAFSSDLCRSVSLDFDKKTETSGLPTYRYHLTSRAFDILEENDCYCPRGKDANFNKVVKCPPKGTMNLMPCMQAPSIFSNPHYFMGDRSLVNFVTGLHPDPKRHEMFAEIEPLTGTPIRGWKKAQMSLFLEPLEDFELLSNVSHGLMPLIWLEEGAELPDYLIEKIRMAYTGIFIIDIVKWVFIGIGLAICLWGLVLFLKRDRLLCYHNRRVANFTQPTRVQVNQNNQNNQNERDNEKDNHNENTISKPDIIFHSSLLYPSLYPQLVNRNVNISGDKISDYNRFSL